MSFGLNQYLALGMAAITSKQKIFFSPGGRIIHICSRLRNPGSPLRATCSQQVHMQSRRWNYHHGSHFLDEKTEVKRLDQGHTAQKLHHVAQGLLFPNPLHPYLLAAGNLFSISVIVSF